MEMLFQIAKHTCAVMHALFVNEFVKYSVCGSEQGETTSLLYTYDAVSLKSLQNYMFLVALQLNCALLYSDNACSGVPCIKNTCHDGGLFCQRQFLAAEIRQTAILD